MQRVDTIEQLRAARRALKGSVAFVPTLGFLHEGHLALMREGLHRCDRLVVSVFVNPTQFGPDEDLENYPRDLDGDAEKCRDIGCDILFTPGRNQIYADDHCTWVNVEGLTDTLCGASRPGHFRGVTTIVTKLLNIVAPDVAVFGRKDYQQLAVIRRMVRDLNLPVDIAGVDTVREPDGLATSSRNRYLTDEQRRQAPCLARGLVAARRAWASDPQRPCSEILKAARDPIERQPDTRIDYLQCVHPHTLEAFHPHQPIDEAGAVVAMAVFLGEARLIDNLRIDEQLPEGPLREI